MSGIHEVLPWLTSAQSLEWYSSGFSRPANLVRSWDPTWRLLHINTTQEVQGDLFPEWVFFEATSNSSWMERAYPRQKCYKQTTFWNINSLFQADEFECSFGRPALWFIVKEFMRDHEKVCFVMHPEIFERCFTTARSIPSCLIFPFMSRTSTLSFWRNLVWGCTSHFYGSQQWTG